MFVPDHVGFLRPPKHFAPFTNHTVAIPVLRTEDDYSIPFFYYGEGCSDMYIHANSSTGLVVHDRLDAIRRLGPRNTQKVSNHFLNWCEHAIERAAVKYIAPTLLYHDTHDTHGDHAAIRAAVTGSGCMNEMVHQLMRQHDIETLVLNFEAPGGGGDATLRTRKTEIVYLGNKFYNASGDLCERRSFHACHCCAESTVSYQTCTGQLRAI